MRLTIELINNAPQEINPTKDRMLSLRGCKITIIENLGVTKDHFDCIDLADNEIIKLGNIPPLKRLKTLILANNCITRIAPDLHASSPSLTSIVLTNNRIELLCDIVPLFKLQDLDRLVLIDNPVVRKPHYRELLVFCIPKLRFLDFHRIGQKDRDDAKALFAETKGEELLKSLVAPRNPKAGTNTEPMKPRDPNAHLPYQLSTENIEKIKAAITKAKTVADVTNLEKALRSGIFPAELLNEETA